MAAPPPVPPAWVAPVAPLALGTSNNFPTGKVPQYRRQRQWLARSRDWPELNDLDWAPVAVIGGGSYGLCGRWTRRRPIPGIPLAPQDIVVKQVGKSQSHQMMFRYESKLLRDLKALNSEHIIELYYGYHKAGGTGTLSIARRGPPGGPYLRTPVVDPLPFKNNAQGQRVWDPNREVARMYIEWCPEGDLQTMIDNVINANRNGNAGPQWVPEEDLWKIFECLTRAVLCLEKGNENPRALITNPPWRRIAHLDIKPGNIFLGTTGTGTHPTLETAKFADFGHALSLPQEQLVAGSQDLQPIAPSEAQTWWEHARWRGTPGYRPPEQLYIHGDIAVKHRDWCQNYRKMNVWAIGAVMHELITGREVNMEKRWMHRTHLDLPDVENGHNPFTALGLDFFGGYSIGKTAQTRVNDPPGYTTTGLTRLPYTKRLLDLVLRCIAYKPKDRIPISQLASTITAHINDNYPRVAPPTNTLRNHRNWGLPAAAPRPPRSRRRDPVGDLRWRQFYDREGHLTPKMNIVPNDRPQEDMNAVAAPPNLPNPGLEDVNIVTILGNPPLAATGPLAVATQVPLAQWGHQRMPPTTARSPYR